MRLRVAAVAWKLRTLTGDGEFFGHLHDLITDAHHQGAHVVVLPELFSMELLPLASDLEDKDVPAYLVQYADALEEWLMRISNSSGMILIGGSHFRAHKGRKQNCAFMMHPALGPFFEPKIKLSKYEREMWRLSPGEGLTGLPESEIGVTVGHDAEYPESARTLAETGVLVHCVPSLTLSAQDFQRARHACHARANENQNFVVHASLLGSLGRQPLMNSYGSSAILSPAVSPFPDNAVLAETIPNEEGVVVASLDLELLREVRELGEYRHWEHRDADVWKMDDPED